MPNNHKQKNQTLIVGLLSIAILLSLSLVSKAADRDFFQIKIYTLDNDAQEARMDKYLKEAYLPALHRAGISKAGVFKPIESDTANGNIIVVFIPFKSLEQFEVLPQKLGKDKKYQADGSDYLDAAHDNPPYERIESTILKAFSEMPHFEAPDHASPPSDRIYELRSYEGATERLYETKVEMFNEAGEVALFKKLDFQALFYGEVISGAHMPNLMYMITFSDLESQTEHWNAFRTSPEWTEMKKIEKYKNTVSNITKYLLHPTDYSDI